MADLTKDGNISPRDKLQKMKTPDLVITPNSPLKSPREKNDNNNNNGKDDKAATSSRRSGGTLSRKRSGSKSTASSAFATNGNGNDSEGEHQDKEKKKKHKKKGKDKEHNGEHRSSGSSEVRTENPLLNSANNNGRPPSPRMPSSPHPPSSPGSPHSVRWKEENEVTYIPSKEAQRKNQQQHKPQTADWKREALKNRGVVMLNEDGSPRGTGSESSPKSKEDGDATADNDKNPKSTDLNDLDGVDDEKKSPRKKSKKKHHDADSAHNNNDTANDTEKKKHKKKSKKKESASKSANKDGDKDVDDTANSAANATPTASASAATLAAPTATGDSQTPSPSGPKPGSAEWKRQALFGNGVFRSNSPRAPGSGTTLSPPSSPADPSKDPAAANAVSGGAAAASSRLAAAGRRASLSSSSNHAHKTLASPQTVRERKLRDEQAQAAANAVAESNEKSSSLQVPGALPEKPKGGKALMRSWSFRKSPKPEEPQAKKASSAKYMGGTLRMSKSPYREADEETVNINIIQKTFDGTVSERRESAWKRRALANRGVVSEESSGKEKSFSRLSVLLSLVEEQEKAAKKADEADDKQRVRSSTEGCAPSAEKDKRNALRAQRLKTVKAVAQEAIAELLADLETRQKTLQQQKAGEVKVDDGAMIAQYCMANAYAFCLEYDIPDPDPSM